MSDRDVKHLCPALQAVVPPFIKACADKGIDARIIVTFRDSKTQEACRKLGLSKAGAGQSPHNLTDAQGRPASRAFDFGVFDNGKYITDGSDPRYAQAGSIGVSFGLVYGGSWKSFRDMDHLEMPNWKGKSYAPALKTQPEEMEHRSA